MMVSQSRYDDVWAEALSAEAAVRELRRIERGYRHALAMTDGLLGELEQRNLDGQRGLDKVVRRDLARTLTELPDDARSRFPKAGSVQEALDGIFLVQESLLFVLQRMLHWDRLVATDPHEHPSGGRELAERSA